MTAHTDLLIPALEAALENRQLQPVIRDIVKNRRRRIFYVRNRRIF